MTQATPSTYTFEDLQRFVSALSYSATRHQDQRRKNVRKTPYINHPIALVHVLVVEAGVTDKDAIDAALLHDTIEDTGATKEDLHARFGDGVKDVVVAMSDDKSLPKAERKRLQIVHATDWNYSARLAEYADKICNMRDLSVEFPEGWTLERVREFFDWAKSVIDEIRGTHAKLDALFDEAYALRP
jgi:guanosine-3',5'-bis(diphosphate) 3'-pyrophosphohydrolase